MKLNRSISNLGMLFAAVAGITGSGWLFGPFYAAQLTGPSAILSWLIGGILMIVVGLTFAELASTFPMTGGSVRFLQLSHGPLVSYTLAWIGWISNAAVAPIETMALLHYLSDYWPGILHQQGGIHVLTGFGILVAAVIMFLICCLNIVGIRFLARTNNLFTFVKLGVPIITVIILFSMHFHVSNFVSAGFAPQGFKGIVMALPMAGVIFSFIGYTPAIQLAGEAKNPQTAIPLAIIGSLLIAVVLYSALQIAFIGVLPATDLQHGWQNLHFQGEQGPFFGILMSLGVIWLAYLLIFGAIVSPFGTALIYTTATARMTYAMGENGYLPLFLMKLNRFGIPMRIIWLNYIIGLFLFLPFPTWQNLVEFLVSALVLAYAVGPLSLLVLRKTLPDQPRPFKLPAPKIICLLAFYICNLIIYWTGWETMAKMLITIAIGFVVLAIYCSIEKKRLNLEWSKSWWVFLYLILLGVMTYLGSFGKGLGIIPFGWDFLFIAVISWVVFEFSQNCVLRTLPLTKNSSEEEMVVS